MIITYMDVIILLSVFIIGLYIYGNKIYSHYQATGVKFMKPPVPFLGSSLKLLLQREHVIDFLRNTYNYYPEEKYIGVFDFNKPTLILRDLDLIKQIAVKDFDSFLNHANIVKEDLDVLFGNSLVSMEGDKWRDMRATLSPAFTSSKMRNMFEFVEECAKDVVNYYFTQMKNTGKDVMEMEIKNELSKFTNDVIATAAYGIKVNSFENAENEFYKLGKGATNFQGIQLFKFFLFALIPKIMKMLKVQFISEEVTSFFRGVVLNTMKYRDENKIVRNDMIHLLMEAKKGSLKHDNDPDDNLDAGFATVQESSMGKRVVKRNWSDDELVAQAFIFFFGGFETVSTFLTFFFYEMVRNPDIQKKLQDEIDEFNSNSEGKFIYNDLQKLKYLDMCTSESLRIWPPSVITDRVCNKNYTIPSPSDSSDKSYQIKTGEAVWIPIYSIHHDPKYYPNPTQFDPERFSHENKSSLNPMAYMPFGIGPRNCIGSRFALMESKVIIFHLLANFDFVPTEKTNIPVILDKSSFNLSAKGGMHLGMKPRIMNRT